ncbi:hypothetical protein CRU93_00520 [Arcobacter sp. CECT 8985]|nr:hypothetical protein CRU93_00520 [Arcobacter sp. CECT 8985]
MMMTTIKQFAKVFIIIDFCLIVYALVFQNFYWIVNSQVAFFSSMIISIASFLSYKKNVTNRLKNYDASLKDEGEDRDIIDDIDDPYDLYSEQIETKEEELTASKIKQIIKEEKSKVKRNSFKNTIFSAGGFLSIYRIIGYLFLVLGFFTLNNHNKFIPIAFLIGLAVVPIAVLLTKPILKSEVSQ